MSYLNKSNLILYNTCHKKFDYIVNQKLATPESAALRSGKEIHKWVEDFWKNLDLSQGLKIPELPKDNAKVFRCLQNFIRFEMKRYESLQSEIGEAKAKELFKPKLIEHKIANDILGINGIADRVDTLANGEYCVVDIKSSNYNNFSSNYNFELHFYKLLLDKSGLLDKPVKYGVIYLVQNNEFYFFELGDTKFIEDIIIQSRIEIEKQMFEKSINAPCQYCEFYDNCWKDKKLIKANL